jgi:TatD DNase family protein
MTIASDLCFGESSARRMAEFFDTHAHLDFPDFGADLNAVVERAEAASITRIVCIGTDLASSRRAVEIAEQFPGVFASVGWHPCHVLEAPEDVRPALAELARHPKVVAIGETGLDHYRLPSANGGSASDDERYKARQVSIFQQQLEVAATCGLNCVIHQRSAFDQTLALLAPWCDRVRGVFHCFAGTPSEVERVLALGSLVSFTGILTFKNGANIREALAATPHGRFMLETDCPYLAPVPNRGKRCEPAFVADIAAVAAEVKKCSLDELGASSCATAREFFPKLCG